MTHHSQFWHVHIVVVHRSYRLSLNFYPNNRSQEISNNTSLMRQGGWLWNLSAQVPKNVARTLDETGQKLCNFVASNEEWKYLPWANSENAQVYRHENIYHRKEVLLILHSHPEVRNGILDKVSCHSKCVTEVLGQNMKMHRTKMLRVLKQQQR